MNSFRKEEKLCHKKDISLLFEKGNVIYSYPYKILWNEASSSNKYPVRIILTVSKRLFKKAVSRNLIKRRMREAYRFNKPLLYNNLNTSGRQINCIVLYIARDTKPFSLMNKEMGVLLNKLSQNISSMHF